MSIPTEEWAKGMHGEPYSAEQAFALVKAIKEGLIEFDGDPQSLLDFLKPWPYDPSAPKFPEVCVWPEKADEFIKAL